MFWAVLALSGINVGLAGIGSSISTSKSDQASALRILKLANEVSNRGVRSKCEGHSGLPYVMVSYAQTIDGSIAPTTRGRMDISSKTSFQMLHSLRANSDAVLVGINTLLLDNPQLNVRDPLPGVITPEEDAQPRSVVLDSTLRFFRGSTTSLRVQRPIVFTCVPSDDARFRHASDLLATCGGTVVTARETEDGRCDMVDCLRRLKRDHGVEKLLVEGGARILQDVLEQGVADQVLVTMQPCFLGGYRALTRQLARPVPLEDIAVATVEGDIIIHGSIANEGHRDGGNSGSRGTGGSNIAESRSLSFRRAKNVKML